MKEATLFVDHTPTKLNAVALVPPPNGGKSKAKGALGGGRSNGGEASDLDGPHPNPPPWGERISELKVISKKEHPIQRPSWGLALPEGTPSPSLARIFAEELFVIFMHNSFRCWWIHYWESPNSTAIAHAIPFDQFRTGLDAGFLR